MGDEGFLSHYSGRKRAIYEAAVNRLRTRGLRTSDAYLSTFVKAEKINLTSKPDPAPRVIQPRSPQFNVCVGRYLRHLEAQVYRHISKVWGGPTVMKHYTSEEVASHIKQAWDEFKDPCAIGLDASRFDQHVSEEALKWEHGIYLSYFRPSARPKLAALLRQQLVNKGFARVKDGLVKYTVRGCRMSGDMNTALGNCLLMSAMVWAYADEVGVKCRLINNGDDCTVIMDRKHAKEFRAGLDKWFEEMGFTMKVEDTVTILEHIEFCQSHPVCIRGQWTMVRNPHVAVAKDLTCVGAGIHGLAGFRKWLGAVGQGGEAIAGDVPVFHALYRYMQREGLAGNVSKSTWLADSGFFRLAARATRKFGAPTPECRVSFWLAFGIRPDMQVALEDRLLAQGAPVRGSPRVRSTLIENWHT